MRTIRLVLLSLVLFLSGCACKAPLQVIGHGNQVGFGVQDPYRIARLEVVEWSKAGQPAPKWRIEGANLEGVYYATHSAAFETTYEATRLDSGVYSVRFECVSASGKRCKREQLFVIPAPDGAAKACKTRQECQSLVLPEVTAR